jgi:hypothetical protein
MLDLGGCCFSCSVSFLYFFYLCFLTELLFSLLTFCPLTTKWHLYLHCYIKQRHFSRGYLPYRVHCILPIWEPLQLSNPTI